MSNWVIDKVLILIISLLGAFAADPRCALPEEVWSDCDAFCQKTCAEPNGPLPCSDFCTPGCVCADGLVRTGSRACVRPCECTPTSMNCPGPNEVLDRCQANGCQNTCLEPGRIAYCDPLGCSFGCICLKGYVRNCRGVCTWAEDCVKCEDVNAHWSNFNGTICQNTCVKPDQSTYCTADPDAGCVCNDDFLKSDDGVCLPAEDCAVCDDPNAVYSLTRATGCQNTCEAPDLETRCLPAGPEAGCVCKEGFVKNKRGLCIRLCECGTSVCGVNEHLELCPVSCPPDNCSAIGLEVFCPTEPPMNCKPDCKCNLNYRRDGRGICVPIKDCPPLVCSGQNEIYEACPLACDVEDCAGLTNCTPCHEDPGALICRPACRCIDGYYRKFINNENVCVPKEECFKCTGENEVYIENGPACEANCNSLYTEEVCIQEVRSGCFCREGFIRNSTGQCIEVKDCYLDLCGPNEVRSCGSGCDTTCANLNSSCPIANGQCNSMCYCGEGLARDDCGKCIPIDHCPEPAGCKGDLHAEDVLCPNPCPDSCDYYLNNCGSTKPPCRRACVREGCQCDVGYIQDETTNNYCVKPENCHKCTGPNEVWSSNVDCTCDEIDKVCQSKTANGTEGCRCIDGYVRHADGTCIQAGMCPRCGPLEEYLSCGSACPSTCKDPIQHGCIEICVPGCFCKPGLIRDTNGKCVEPSQCTKNTCIDMSNQCGPLEVYKECGTACPNTCYNQNAEGEDCTLQCVRGCYCAGTLIRNAKGQCVQPDQCFK